jgi:hypothetical protein
MNRFKIVYAQARKPGIDRLAFVGLWREHGGMAMQLADYFGKVVRYVQADAILTTANPANPPRDYDGVGEIAFNTLADLEAANAAPSREAIVLPHGRKIFGSPHPIGLIAEECIAWNDRPAEAKLYTFVKRPAGLSREEFAAQWAQACRTWGEDERIRGEVRQYARCISVKPESEFDGVEEITFDRLDQARQALADQQFLVRSLPLDGSVTILAQSVALLDTSLFS